MHDYCKIGNEMIQVYQPKLDGWKCKLNNRRSSWGLCDYSRKTIYLSKYLVQYGTEDEILQTLLHELAHALTPEDRGHGADWLAVARRLGYTGGRCADRVLPVKHKYIGHCGSGHRFVRHRMRGSGGYCTACHDRGHGLETCKVRWYDRHKDEDVRVFIRNFGGTEFEQFEHRLKEPLTSVSIFA